MARGAPDWFDQSQITYGAIHAIQYAELVVPATFGSIADVSGRGIFLGGMVFSEALGSQTLDAVVFVVDEVLLANTDLVTLHTYGIDRPGVHPTYITRYNNFTFRYGVGITPGYTFVKSFLARYDNNGANNAAVWARIFYAEIV